MKYWDKIKMFIVSPRVRFEYFSKLGFLNWMDDEKYLKKKYYYTFDRGLNLNNPGTFNEKLQWLKLYDRKDIYTTMVDKYEAKKYVADNIGKDYIIPTLGVYDKFGDIDFNNLPDRFVIKSTHDSGGLVIVRDIKIFNKNKAKKKIDRSLRRNYYSGREWPYKNVKPRIIVEKYLEDNTNKSMRDYKFVYGLEMSIHNGIVQALTCYGVFGFLCFIYIIVRPIMIAIKQRQIFYNYIPLIVCLAFVQTIQLLNPYFLLFPFAVSYLALFVHPNNYKMEIEDVRN